METSRIKILNGSLNKGNTLYLMSRNLRLYNNCAIDYAYENSLDVEFYIGVEIQELSVNTIQHNFSTQTLIEMEKDCNKFNIFFSVIDDLDEFVIKNKIKMAIIDFSPMEKHVTYKHRVLSICEKRGIKLIMVDAFNIVPACEFKIYNKNPRSISMKISEKLYEHFTTLQKRETFKYNKNVNNSNNLEEKLKTIKYNTLPLKKQVIGGYSEALKHLDIFIDEELRFYNLNKTTAHHKTTRDLNIYIQNGVIFSGEVFNKILEHFDPEDINIKRVFKEIIIWKETADHYCMFNENYDQFKTLQPWASDTLILHSGEKGNRFYTEEEIEKAQTNNEEFNCAQKELVLTGKINEYVKVFWAKRFHYFVECPKEAIRIMFNIYNKYALDAGKPMSVLTLMYGAGGIMDRGFKQIKILGKIRGFKGLDSESYVNCWKDFEI